MKKMHIELETKQKYNSKHRIMEKCTWKQNKNKMKYLRVNPQPYKRKNHTNIHV